MAGMWLFMAGMKGMQGIGLNLLRGLLLGGDRLDFFWAVTRRDRLFG